MVSLAFRDALVGKARQNYVGYHGNSRRVRENHMSRRHADNSTSRVTLALRLTFVLWHGRALT